jgi:hypothetical protein
MGSTATETYESIEDAVCSDGRFSADLWERVD